MMTLNQARSEAINAKWSMLGDNRVSRDACFVWRVVSLDHDLLLTNHSPVLILYIIEYQDIAYLTVQ